MAFFGVTIETIEKVWDHPNADRLSLAKMKGLAFQFVIGKNQFQEGQKVLYFPIDAVLTQELIEKMGMVGKFSGKDKNRIKTLKLRQQISQGFVMPPEKLLTPEQMGLSSEELTDLLKVTKYEPPVTFSKDGFLLELPEGCSKYDIEGADRFGQIVEILMDQEVVVFEKMEGTNHSVFKSEALFVNQRNNTIKEKENSTHSYWEVARKTKLVEYMQKQNNMAIYSEFCGPSIQKNIYALKEGTLFVFDIKKDGKWVDFKTFQEEVEKLKKETGVSVAPILFVGKLKDYLQGKSIQEVSNGFSVVNPKVLREGIVVKPVVEQYHQDIGRLIIKQRSPEYLSNED